MDGSIIFLLYSGIVGTGMYINLLGKQCKKNRNRNRYRI